MKYFYLCTRCNEQFFTSSNLNIRCPSCGFSKANPILLNYNLKEKNITIENVVHGHKNEGIIRINITGERKKGLFQCNDCLSVYEFDCTEGIDKVNCPICHCAKYEIKSPIVSVFAGVKGVPDFTRKNLSKSEGKKLKWVKNCYKSRVEIEAVMRRVEILLNCIEYPIEKIEELHKNFDSILKEVDKIHEKKIKDFEEHEAKK